jgi:hypothetical protein
MAAIPVANTAEGLDALLSQLFIRSHNETLSVAAMRVFDRAFCSTAKLGIF